MKSGYFRAAGSTGAALGAQAATNSSSGNPSHRNRTPLDRPALRVLDTRFAANPSTHLRMRIVLRRRRRRQTLDEPPRHVGLDDHAAVGGDVADHAGDAIEPRDLLTVEFGIGVEGDG